MNHFDDLTQYSHQISPFFLNKVFNIGWLNMGDGIPIGDFPNSTFEKLKNISSGVGMFQPILEPIRELPICQFCGEVKMIGASGKFIPNSEIWIPNGEILYAAPIIILHLIEFHNYLPPAEYINAIDDVDIEMNFFAEDVYRRKLQESGWFDKRRTP